MLPDTARYCFRCGGDVGAAADELPSGGDAARAAHAELRARLAQTLDGRYTVRDILGVGGMGVVFLADDLALDRTVAIKVLPPELSGDESIVLRFRREARTAARLDHPGIVPIYRVESEGGLHYFVMKYVAGRSLEDVLRAETPVSIPFAIRILREAAAALAHAHRHGVVHRDVKPDNIMLDASGRVLLADFGISKVSSVTSGATTIARLTESGGVLGTPHYMAPEHALGQTVDGRTDQYSLAIVGFQMLAGRLPFDDETPHAIVHLHISEAPPRLAALRPDVPAHVAAAIGRALSKAAAHRFATMEEFSAAWEGPTTEDAAAAAAAPRSRSDRSRLGTIGSAPTKPILDDEALEFDRVLDRAFTDRAPARRRRGVSWLAFAILILAGLAVSAAWVSGVGHGIARPPVARPVAEARPPAKATRATESRRRTVMLTIASSPRATLFIDGHPVGETPITEHPLTVGRAYQIRLEHKGYRTKRETITVAGSRPIRRIYALERVARH